MSFPRYFRDFPNIDYAIEVNKAGITKHIQIKDYFHLLTVRDDIFREDTLYSPYTIKNGQRPDQISYETYGDEQFYWVILQINQITDFYTQWPLSENELVEYVENKYGREGAEEVRHWETLETFDKSSPANKVLPGGLEVPQNYVYYYKATPDSDVILSARPYAVTNYQYERVLNDNKSQIFLLDPKYIYDYQREVRNYARRLPPSVSYLDISEVNPNY